MERSLPITCDLPGPEEQLQILLIDDDPLWVEYLRLMLEGSDTTAHWALDWRPDPQAASLALRKHAFHLCIVDYCLGAWKGPEVIRTLQEEFPGVPCVLMTSMDTREADVEAMQAGASAFLSKGNVDFHTLERTVRYVLDRARERSALARVARRDPLTNLYNRAAVKERLEKGLARCRRNPGMVLGVAAVDLDGFKSVNDTLGHAEGDQVLREVAACLRATVRAYDTVGRVGGDEFVIVFEQIDHIEEAEALAARIVREVSDQLGHAAGVTASVGMAIYPGCGEDVPEILAAADRAMYQAKRKGKNQYQCAERRHRTLNRPPVESMEVRSAIHSGRLQLAFQPQVDLETGDIDGYEALTRFFDDDGKSVPAEAFIAEIERSGAIKELDMWVLHRAQEIGPPGMSLSVNLSLASLMAPDFLDGIPPARGVVEVELTEGAFAQDDGAVIERLVALKTLGYQVAIDDFGVGYSSLARFSQMPVDTLKIDRCFTADIKSRTSRSVIQSLVYLSGLEQLRLVAEGVETLPQSQALRSLGVSIGQGFLLGRPMLSEQLSEWIFANRRGEG